MKGPVVVLPNHPGYIDPFLLFGVLWPSLRMRPLVYRGTFQGFTGRLLVRLVNALEVPDLDVASVRARNEAEQAVAAIVAGLGRGERFILWPAGRVCATASSESDPPAPPPTSSGPFPRAAWSWCAPAASGARRGPGRN